MATQTGNLSSAERTLSALFGLGFSLLALQRGSPLVRIITGLGGASLLARAVSGHCAVKAMVTHGTPWKDAVADQWRAMSNSPSDGLPGSPVHTAKSSAVDEAVAESFPASDPPASRIPDEPPSNADAKWAAARAAEERARNGAGD